MSTLTDLAARPRPETVRGLRPMAVGRAAVTEPSINEVVRRLDEVTRSVERVAATLESSYVRREVYEAKHEALRAYQTREINEVRGDIKDLQEARKADAAFRRQIMAGAAVGLILLLVNLVLATSNVMARGGL